SILLEPRGNISRAQLIATLRQLIIDWCPAGSDPGLCVTEAVPNAIIEWGQRCKRELVTQQEARKLAAQYSIHLEGLGGTNDGIIGAVAAIGLIAIGNDGRVVHVGANGRDLFEIGGCLTIETILECGVESIQDIYSGQLVAAGTVDVGKRLRPN